MTAEAMHSVPQQDWDVTSVQAVMLPKDKLLWAAPEESALSLLDRMRNVGMQQMPVIAGGSVVGIVTRDSILQVCKPAVRLAPSPGGSRGTPGSTGFSLCAFLLVRQKSKPHRLKPV